MVKISDQPKSLSTGKRVSSSSSAAVSIKSGGGDYDGLLSLAEKSAIDDIERLLKVAQQTLSSRRECGCGCGLLDITNRIACPREALTRSATGGSCCCCCSDCSRQNERTEWHLSKEEETTPPAPHLSNALRTNSANPHQQHQQQQPDAVVDCHALAAVGRQKSDARNDEDDSPSFAAETSADPSRTDPVDAPPPAPRANGGGGGGESPSLHCGGYSKQRRHGRKASLGTTEIKRLIPTLVSENEEFRYKEYRRKSSASAPDDAQNLTL